MHWSKAKCKCDIESLNCLCSIIHNTFIACLVSHERREIEISMTYRYLKKESLWLNDVSE